MKLAACSIIYLDFATLMAGVLAALMSSMDSAINSMSTVTLSDIYRRYIAKDASEQQLVKVAKILTLIFGLLTLAFALWQFDRQGDTGMEKYGKLLNVIASPLVCFFLLGIFSRRTNTGGAVIGAIAGIAFVVVFNGIPGIVEQQLEWINWMWVGGLAIVVNLSVGYVASFLFPPPSNDAVKSVYREEVETED